MPVHEMTCDEVNEALSELRNEKVFVAKTMLGADGQYWPIHVDGPPDYCHDWVWAGKLLEKLVTAVDIVLNHVAEAECPYALYQLEFFSGGLTGLTETTFDELGGGMLLPEAIARAALTLELQKPTV